MERRDWRTDTLRLEGPYGVPAQYLTVDEKRQTESMCAVRDCEPGRPAKWWEWDVNEAILLCGPHAAVFPVLPWTGPVTHVKKWPR